MDSHELLDYVKKRIKTQKSVDYWFPDFSGHCQMPSLSQAEPRKPTYAMKVSLSLSLKRTQTHTHKLVGSQARVQPFKKTAIEYKWGHGFTTRQRLSTTFSEQTQTGKGIKKKTRPLIESDEQKENDTERFVVDMFSLKVECYSEPVSLYSGLIWPVLYGFQHCFTPDVCQINSEFLFQCYSTAQSWDLVKPKADHQSGS